MAKQNGEILPGPGAGGETPPLHEGGEGEAGALALVPFSDNLPYDRNRVIQECKFCLQVEIMARFEVGRRLLLLNFHEGVQTFALILDEHFAGMGRRSTFNYMLFAKKANDLPRFRAWADGKDNWSKALALLECCEDEDLAEFEAGGDILGLKRDELDLLSVRELKARIKKLKKENREGIDKATRELTKENQELKEEKAALEKALGGDADAAIDLVKLAENKFLEGGKFLAKITPAALADNLVRQAVFGSLGMLGRLLQNLEDLADQANIKAAAEAEGSEQ